MNYIRFFEEVGIQDLALVGGKNASLGQMIRELSRRGVRIPGGFATTADAYWYVLTQNNLIEPLKELMAQIGTGSDIAVLKRAGAEARSLISQSHMPEDLVEQIVQAYSDLSRRYEQDDLSVAVRSSATAEDLPEASFAGQQETFLNVKGIDHLCVSVKNCMASLFTDRAISYRIEKGFDHFAVALSVGVQKMVRSDRACAGVSFSIDTETGFKDLIVINASWGLGEALVKGEVNPDEYRVFTKTMQHGQMPIVKKYCGSKAVQLIYANGAGLQKISVSPEQQQQFCLTDDEIMSLAHNTATIEDYYSEKDGTWRPMDIEWAKDGFDHKLYIVQARPETVHAPKAAEQNYLVQYRFVEQTPPSDKLILTGQSIGQHIAAGKAHVVSNIRDIDLFEQGDILVTGMTDPDWVPIMKRASAIVTDRGGRTCHAAIVSRELGISALVGTEKATSVVQSGQSLTVDCSRGSTGYVYDGLFAFEQEKTEIKKLPPAPIPLMLNLADPDRAITFSRLPASGVGLARIEFIISSIIKLHPLAALRPDLLDADTRDKVATLSAAYASPAAYFTQTLAQSIGMIAAAFYPRPVIVRFSDFKSNEYRNLIGGVHFEPEEENPMLGLRGASRYYHEKYREGFALECKALHQVYYDMGLNNVRIMIPFVRTAGEARKVLDLLALNGLHRGKDALEIIMMCEVPSNVILIDEFCAYFDGFSIGSNDLAQTTLAVDRDSGILAALFDERDEAVKQMMLMAIKGAHRHGKPIGLCGQAPSDFPELGWFLIKSGIDSLSLNPDAYLPFLLYCSQVGNR